jgi:hypothetical protein
MEKHLAKWTYWAGVACAVLALFIRALNGLGIYVDFPGMNLGHMSFYKASFLLLAVAIATSVTMQPKDQKQ